MTCGRRTQKRGLQVAKFRRAELDHDSSDYKWHYEAMAVIGTFDSGPIGGIWVSSFSAYIMKSTSS